MVLETGAEKEDIVVGTSTKSLDADEGLDGPSEGVDRKHQMIHSVS